MIERLGALASNHQWSWNESARALFAELPNFDAERHPAALVGELTAAEVQALADDTEFCDRVAAHAEALAALTATTPTNHDVAYFSPEFGVSELVPQYSGGLGILAGDHMKSASDLGISLCGVGLFYRGGFFRQSVDGGRQGERYETYEPAELGCFDTGIEVTVAIADADVTAHVWRFDVGRISLLLLDTDVASNSAKHRAITDRLYSGDRQHRIEQELILGVGGSRALAAMGWDAPVRHLNEGHAGFLIFDLLDRDIAAGLTLAEALAAIGPRLVFTTHTPVPAGIDRFEPALAAGHLAPWAQRWGVSIDEVLELGTDPTDPVAAFNMAALCLKAAKRANGVSQLHGAVSRDLFAGVDGADAIGSITNGIHARTWTMPRLQDVFDERLGAGWENGDAAAWANVSALDDDTIRALRRAGSVELAELVAERTGDTIDPDSLIIGFARRFATYKRANLLLQHPEVLAALLANDDRPVHFVFAGKAHPADNEGKAVLADVLAYGKTSAANDRFTFIPDYDVAVAQAMYAGCDVWLNNPIRPHEASGTSGEKSALNGGLNCSISDGWWDEMADGRNGWTIPDSDSTDPTTRDRAESAAALDILTNEIAAEYFADGTPWSTAWLERMRDNWSSLGPLVTAGRMVADYERELYRPALNDVTG